MGARVAILVDGDNIAAAHADAIRDVGAQAGEVCFLRVYANVRGPADWHGTSGFRVMHAGSGKNAADLLLAIDAVELALRQEVATVVIATSDGDFTHLALRLREFGLRVIGVGEAKAPQAFRLCCTEFRQIAPKAPDVEVKSGPERPPVAIAGAPTELDRQIRAMIAKHSTEGRGMRIVDLNPAMSKAHGTRISTYPERTWRAYLAKRMTLYALDPRGPDARVRFLPKGFA